nr:PREDICTED: limbin [Bos indicus]
MQVLLERAQTEVFSIKQKLDNDLKQEKKKLHQKLIIKRRREMLQKHKEQRREQLSIAEASGAAEDAGQYLGQWRGLMAEHSAALEEKQERLDQAALDELRALTLSLSEKATEELRRLQNSGMTQELLKRGVPWLFLQQILEEHSRDLAARAERLEGEERDRGQEGVQSVRQRLKDDALEASTEEQAELRHWEHLIFTKLCSSAFSLSEEELLGMRQEVHGCFAQMDRSLALPKIRARVLLQRFQTAWREAEFLKLDQAMTAPELQPQSKARKPRSKSRSKMDLLKKCTEDKIQLFKEQAPEDLVEKAIFTNGCYTAASASKIGTPQSAALMFPPKLIGRISTSKRLLFRFFICKNRTQLKAPFTITAEEKITVLPNHGLHAAGFCVAFILSLVLTWAVLFFMVQYQCVKGSSLTRHQVQHHENKLEHSQFTSADGVNEDLALNDQMIDILSSEDPGSMLQALEELEIATLNRADSDLEACRTQISKDIIALLLKNLTSSGQLSPQVERRMGAVFKKQFLLLEKEIQEEYDRKMVALTAECDLETRKKTESQYQREMAAMEEAEEVLKRVSERVRQL